MRDAKNMKINHAWVFQPSLKPHILMTNKFNIFGPDALISLHNSTLEECLQIFPVCLTLSDLSSGR